MRKLQERKDVPLEMTWDLESLYSSLDDWEADFAKLDSQLADFISFKGRLGESAAVLCETLKKDDALDRLSEKVYVFSHLRSDEDTGNSENQARLERIESKLSEMEGETAWLEPELVALPEDVFEKYLVAPELAFYKRTLEDVKRTRSHTLSASEERVLGMLSDTLSTPYKTFSLFSNADLKFPVVKDSKGEKKQLTHGNYIKFLEEPDRKVRKAAFSAMYNTYEKYRNTLATTLSGTVKAHAVNAKLRKYPSALGASLDSDNVPQSVFDNLIKTVRNKLPALFRYFELRSKALGLKKLDMFDMYNPLVPESNVEISWDDACKWVLEACEPMGDEYCSVLASAFKSRWIDVLENKGKKSGAYSGGCYDSFPYILMNFNGTLNSVFTLAHELGHSMHSWHSNKHQEFHYADYSIFVAEVASTTNELLLFEYLMKKNTDKAFRNYLMNHLADEIRGTVYRQTMFSEFEKLIHEMTESGEPLTADALCSKYLKLQTDYHARFVKADKRIQLEWARIPHFYYDFYVYKYATGFSAAAAFSKNILSGDPAKLDAYLGFLKAGDSKDPLDILRDAGVDLSSPAPVEAALDKFAMTVEQLAEGLSIAL